jgi:hypothetical protein
MVSRKTRLYLDCTSVSCPTFEPLAWLRHWTSNIFNFNFNFFEQQKKILRHLNLPVTIVKSNIFAWIKTKTYLLAYGRHFNLLIWITQFLEEA